MLHNILILILTFTISLIIIRIFIPLSKLIKFTDMAGIRKIHLGQIPILGGVGIGVSFAVYLIYQYSTQNITDLYLNKMLAVSFGIFFIGLLDDKFKPNFPFRIKLGMELVAIIIFVLLCGDSIIFFGIKYVDYPILFILLLGMTNAYNLLDNMDNFSSGISIATALYLAVLSFSYGQEETGLLLLALISAILGFHFWNFNPAKIFMGDSGALFLGFILTALSCKLSFSMHKEPFVIANLNAWAIIFPAFMIPIVDTFSVIFIRLKNKKSPFIGDNNHLSHRLVRCGLSTRQAVYLIICIQLFFSLLFFILKDINYNILLPTEIVAFMVIFSLSYKIGNIKIEQACTIVSGNFLHTTDGSV